MIAQCRIVSGVDLINVQIIVCLRTVNFLYICSLLIHLFLYLINFHIRQQILYVYNANAIVCIQCRELTHWTAFQPLLQVNTCMVIQCVQRHDWKCKVINQKSLISNLHRNGIMFMDFRQNFCPIQTNYSCTMLTHIL